MAKAQGFLRVRPVSPDPLGATREVFEQADRDEGIVGPRLVEQALKPRGRVAQRIL
jgi:hypothetical protein